MPKIFFATECTEVTERQFVGHFIATTLRALAELCGPTILGSGSQCANSVQWPLSMNLCLSSVGRPLRGRRVPASARSEIAPYPPILVHGPNTCPDFENRSYP